MRSRSGTRRAHFRNVIDDLLANHFENAPHALDTPKLNMSDLRARLGSGSGLSLPSGYASRTPQNVGRWSILTDSRGWSILTHCSTASVQGTAAAGRGPTPDDERRRDEQVQRSKERAADHRREDERRHAVQEKIHKDQAARLIR